MMFVKVNLLVLLMSIQVIPLVLVMYIWSNNSCPSQPIHKNHVCQSKLTIVNTPSSKSICSNHISLVNSSLLTQQLFFIFCFPFYFF